jgi:SAM-dependent methyltransferase
MHELDRDGMVLSPPPAIPKWRCVAVLASFNEARSIAAVLAELKEAEIALAPSGVELIIVLVDDASPDQTADIAAAWAEQLDLQLDVVQGPRAGLGRAIAFGMQRALTHHPDSVVTLDADGQHNPTYLPTLHRAFIARQADLLIGSRWTRGGTSPGTSLVRTVGSRAGNRMFRVVSGVRGVRDATTSFRVYSPRLVEYLLNAPSQRFDGYSFFSTTVALAEAAGFAISEVPITFRPRYSGSSKFGLKAAWQFFATLPQLRAERRAGNFAGSESEYRAKDELRVLSDAANWNAHIVDTLVRDLPADGVRRILEVGAGIGGITTALRARFPDATITCLEPDAENATGLAARFADDPAVRVVAQDFDGYRTEHDGERFDLVVYVNVLEHIEDDRAEVAKAASVLDPGGAVAVLVPAMPGLYGPIDFKSGHFRRYRTRDLHEIIEAAGLIPSRVEYFDPIGIVPYWLNYRVLNKSGISSTGVWTFDRVLVPAMKLVQNARSSWPVGKNVLCVAVAPAPPAR